MSFVALSCCTVNFIIYPFLWKWNHIYDKWHKIESHDSIHLPFHAENGNMLQNGCLMKSMQLLLTKNVNNTYILRICITSFTWTFTCTFSTAYARSAMSVPTTKWVDSKEKSSTVSSIGHKYHEAKPQWGLLKPQGNHKPLNRFINITCWQKKIVLDNFHALHKMC